MSNMLRKLRITFSVACGIVCLLLVALWVRSYWIQDVIWGWFPHGGYLQVNFDHGHVKVIANGERQEPKWRYRSRVPNVPKLTWYYNLDRASRYGWWLDIKAPLWFVSIVVAAAGAVPCVQWSKRFSLRTLLIATTLVAVALGLVVALR
jgi:hypothetical protein